MKKFNNYNYTTDDCYLQTSGVLFVADTEAEAIRRYKAGETVFWSNWRGSFWGILEDKIQGVTLLFNDQIGSKLLFYAQTAEGLVWDTDLYALARKIGAKADNEDYLWQMLIYGYSPVGDTVFSKIHRLQAGEYIFAQGTKVERRTYHRFDNTPNNLSVEENIERLDAAFRQAVTRAIRKNEEYGYTHFLPLSAGLDSRMVNRVAHEIARTPIHNITYSQMGFYDETTPRELAEYWHNDMHFTPLDNGDCLMNLDEVSRMTCGLVHYSGAAETLFGMPEEAKQNGGVFLTGMLGDIIVGTAFTKCTSRQKYHIGEGAIIPGYTSRLRQSLPTDFEKQYVNREMYYLYTRGFNCACLGSPLIQQAFGESYSPFCDVDVLQVAYSIPVSQRWNNRIYDQWIFRKYPDITRWKHNGIYAIGERPRMISLFERAIPLNEVPKRLVWFLLKKLHIHNFYRETEGKTMTPEDSWFAQNTSLKVWAENYIHANIGLLNDFPEVRKMAEKFSHGNATEQMQVLSLLACLRQTR